MKHLTSKKITNVKNDVQGQGPGPGICFCSSCTLTCEGGCNVCGGSCSANCSGHFIF